MRRRMYGIHFIINRTRNKEGKYSENRLLEKQIVCRNCRDKSLPTLFLLSFNFVLNTYNYPSKS